MQWRVHALCEPWAATRVHSDECASGGLFERLECNLAGCRRPRASCLANLDRTVNLKRSDRPMARLRLKLIVSRFFQELEHGPEQVLVTLFLEQ